MGSLVTHPRHLRVGKRMSMCSIGDSRRAVDPMRIRTHETSSMECTYVGEGYEWLIGPDCGRIWISIEVESNLCITKECCAISETE